jgi:hypothetical protein
LAAVLAKNTGEALAVADVDAALRNDGVFEVVGERGAAAVRGAA